jgi:hypothetical protein
MTENWISSLIINNNNNLLMIIYMHTDNYIILLDRESVINYVKFIIS